jgi:Rrf2 family protein
MGYDSPCRVLRYAAGAFSFYGQGQHMQFSQSVTYAIQSLLQLADVEPGVFITRVKLATRGKMPERFLLEVLHELVKCGIVRSNRGGGGGFALARAADEISLLDVVEAVDGPLQSGLPGGNNMPAAVGDCLQANLERIMKAMRAELAGINLKQLVAAGVGGCAGDSGQA